MEMSDEYFNALLGEAKEVEKRAFALYNAIRPTDERVSEWAEARCKWNRAFGYVLALEDMMANTNRAFAKMVRG